MAPQFVARVQRFMEETALPKIVAECFSGSDYPLAAVGWKVSALEAVLGRCESPIEQLVALAFASEWFLEDAEITEQTGRFASDLRRMTIEVRQQVSVCGYRLDFAVTDTTDGWKIAIECDGHDFHDRTPAQAERDKSRDRVLAAAGWRVLRFTGREIYRDPTVVVRDVVSVISTILGAEASV